MNLRFVLPCVMLFALPASAAGKGLDSHELERILGRGNRPEVNQAIERIKYQGRPQALMRTLNAVVINGDVRGRQSAAYALQLLADKSSAGALTMALGDEDAVVRQHAANALGKLRAKAATKKLRELLADTSPPVRKEATTALGLIGDKAAYKELVELLEDGTPDVRLAAILALGQLGDGRAKEKLQPLTGSPSELTRFAAIRSMAMLGDAGARKQIESMLASEQVQDRRDGVRLLDDVKQKWVAPALAGMLEDPALPVRIDAAKALSTIGDGRGVQYLVLAGASPSVDPTEKLKLERALEEIGVSDADRKKILAAAKK